MNDNMNTQTIQPAETDERKAPKITAVKKIELTGPITKKLGAINNSFQVQLFVTELLEKVTNDDLIRFKKRFASSTKEIHEFVEKIEYCDTELDF